MGLKPMKARAMAMDQAMNYFVLLVDEKETIALPILIGEAEATAIATELQAVKLPRPLTADLLKTVLDKLSVKVIRVAVTEIKDRTFYAEIHLVENGAPLVIDARPSDAIALALRAQAPIFVEEKVISASQTLRLKQRDIPQGELEQMLRDIQNAKPTDFDPNKGPLH